LSEAGNISAYTWNQTEVTETLALVEAFLAARAAYEGVDSSQNRLAKDEARAAAQTAMRDFANTSIRHNKKMHYEARLFYGIKPPDTTHTASAEPTSFPEAEGDTGTPREIIIHYWDSETKKRGKGHGIHGAEIRWAALELPPESIDELKNSEFDTASPFTLKFDENMRGKRVYFCLRWENTTNLKGPWSEIYSSIIP
jgi:hypothetical protein